MTLVAKIAMGSLFVCSLALAQSPTQAVAANPSSEMVSSRESSPATAAEPSIKLLPKAAPVTDMDADILVDPASLLPDPPRLPQAKATLIGGTLERLDRVRDQVTVRVFGGGRMNVLFDPRTRVFEGQKPGTIADLKVGERIYLDTILDGNTVFARSIRLKRVQAVGESQGVVLEYRAGGELTLRDSISPTPIRVKVNGSTRFVQGNREVQANSLREGSLVAIRFSSEANGKDVAREISILASPGTAYTFAGQVLHIDLRTGLLVLSSSTDGKTYEIYLDPSAAPDDNLQVGSLVNIVTSYQDSKYIAKSLKIDSQAR